LSYEPDPIDTSKVTLEGQILELTELLSRNVHDMWARQRLSGGWRHGRERNDTLKEHPCLIAYEELPESEKEFDRNIVLGVIKSILALGYRIEPPASPHPQTHAGRRYPAGPTPGVPAGRQSTELARLLDEAHTLDSTSLLTIWQARNLVVWSHSPQAYRRLAEQILRSGEPLVAHEVATEGLEYWPGDVKLRQLLALALARSGAAQRANAVILELQQEGHVDEETLGMLARTHKDLALAATNPSEREAHLRRAAAAYSRAYQQTGGYWTGANAATMAVLLGDMDQATTLAREVRSACLQALDPAQGTDADRYWPLAALGEVALILGEWSEAEDWYGRAAEVGRGRLGDLSTTRRNARLLLDQRGGDRERIERCLRIPRVVAFTGHMMDGLNHAGPRFPQQIERVASDAIRQRLEKLDARLGYASAACGSDLLFLEAILALKGEAHIVLPYDKEQFRSNSVEIVSGASWGERYDRVLQEAAEVVIASEQRLEADDTAYEYANLLLLGLASLRAQQLETELVVLAVWDGRPGGGPGGTASTVQSWRKLGHEVELINLAEILRHESYQLPPGSGSPEPRPRVRPPVKSPRLPAQIRAILFADAVGFSKLTEEEIPRFAEHYLGVIADLAARHAPLVKNTWGDGLYFVFADIREAGHFALEVCALIDETDWAEKGLPAGMGVRIALHAGPVYRCKDPITRKANYLGMHVSRAARIEPITPPNQVYVSQAYAALISSQRVTDLACEYVGQLPLAKEYGTYPTYHLLRRRR
jgi:class 3 adenylate cyclase